MNANIEGIEDNYTPLIIKPSVIKGINYKMEVASAMLKVPSYSQVYFLRKRPSLKN